MPFALTDSLVTLCDYYMKLLGDNQAQIGFQGLYFGDQEILAEGMTVCVEPGSKPRELVGSPRRTEVMMRVYILVYHSTIEGTEKLRRDNVVMAEAIETLIHSDHNADGLAIHTLVTNLEAGYQQRAGKTVRASRLTIEVQSRVNLA